VGGICRRTAIALDQRWRWNAVHVKEDEQTSASLESNLGAGIAGRRDRQRRAFADKRDRRRGTVTFGYQL
jgi:hypothetical protein